MGVIPCYRGDCQNIMCDRQGADGNLCQDCFDELVKRGVHANLEEFMNSDVDPDAGWAEMDSYAYWDKQFPKWEDRNDASL